MEIKIRYVTVRGREKVVTVDDKATSIDLMDEGIRNIDLSPLSECSKLQELSLSGNRLESIDLSPLSECSQLQGLSLLGNRLESIDLSPLSKYSQRIYLSLDDSVRLVADRSVMPALKRVLDSYVFERVEAVEGAGRLAGTGVRERPVGSKAGTQVTRQELGRAEESGRVTAVRGYELVGGAFEYKVKVVNESDKVVTDVLVSVLAYPQDCLALEGERERRFAKIEPAGFVAPLFVFRPTHDCVKGTIKSIVAYTDYRNSTQMPVVEDLEIRSVCDLLTPQRITMAALSDLLARPDGTSKEQRVDLNPQVLFRVLESLVVARNFYLVESEHSVVGEQFYGSLRATARGKYTSRRVFMEVVITGLTGGSESSIHISSKGDDPAMLPVAINEFSEKIEELLTLTRDILNDTTVLRRDNRMLMDSMTMLLRTAEESQQTISAMQHALETLQKRADDTWEATRDVLSVALVGFSTLSTGQCTLEQALSDVADRLEKVARQRGVDRTVRDELQALFKDALKRGAEKAGVAIWQLVKAGLAAVGIPLPF